MPSHHLASGSPNPLVPHWPELIIGTIAFLIVFYVLGRVLMPRISKTLEERTEAIDEIGPHVLADSPLRNSVKAAKPRKKRCAAARR